MKSVDIRVTIRVPDRDEYFIPEAIEKITAFVKSLFPSLEHVENWSPVVVTIKDVQEEVKP